MSLAIGHFALGVAGTVTFLLASDLYQRVRHPGVVAVFGGLWSLIPDAHQFLPVRAWLHESVYTNLFWFHRLLDRFDPSDSVKMSVGLLLLMVVTLLTLLLIDR
jgi:hypothetical protein